MRKTNAELAAESLTPDQRRVLETAYDLPSYASNKSAFEKKLGKLMYAWKFRKEGLTPHEIATMLEIQRERCYICQRQRCDLLPTKKERWDIDHDKSSLKIRGVLCSTCNRWLGTLERRSAQGIQSALERAKKYVENPPAKQAGIEKSVTFDADRPRVELTGAQKGKLFELESTGATSEEIAKQLGVKRQTVERHLRLRNRRIVASLRN